MRFKPEIGGPLALFSTAWPPGGVPDRRNPRAVGRWANLGPQQGWDREPGGGRRRCVKIRSFVVHEWNFSVPRPPVLIGIRPNVDRAVGEVSFLSARALGEVKFDLRNDRGK